LSVWDAFGQLEHVAPRVAEEREPGADVIDLERLVDDVDAALAKFGERLVDAVDGQAHVVVPVRRQAGVDVAEHRLGGRARAGQDLQVEVVLVRRYDVGEGQVTVWPRLQHPPAHRVDPEGTGLLEVGVPDAHVVPAHRGERRVSDLGWISRKRHAFYLLLVFDCVALQRR